MPLELTTSLWGETHTVVVDRILAHFAGLAYGDGYAVTGEVRIVTSDPQFADRLTGIVQQIARENGGTTREYVRPGNISDNSQHTIVLNSTLVRRALFDESMQPNYDSIHSILMDDQLAADAQAGLSDAESNFVLPKPVENPHGRIFPLINSDRRLLGIARLSLVTKIRLEPTSVRTRLKSKKGRKHSVNGIEIVTRKNNYQIEILSGAKKKWLASVGGLLWHPRKYECAKALATTFGMSLAPEFDLQGWYEE